MEYSTIIFDFGKVLIDYDYDAVVKRLFPTSELYELFGVTFCSEEFIRECDLGNKPLLELLRNLICIAPEYETVFNSFDPEGRDLVTGEIPGMRQLLVELKKQNIRLLGLTNWSSMVYPIMERYHELFSLLDGSLISSEEHMVKPDRCIYERLIDKFGLKPDECLFVDDNPANIAGAKAVGINGHLFTTAESLREFLEM